MHFHCFPISSMIIHVSAADLILFSFFDRCSLFLSRVDFCFGHFPVFDFFTFCSRVFLHRSVTISLVSPHTNCHHFFRSATVDGPLRRFRPSLPSFSRRRSPSFRLCSPPVGIHSSQIYFFMVSSSILVLSLFECGPPLPLGFLLFSFFGGRAPLSIHGGWRFTQSGDCVG
ncbi:hypothetical protein Dimus_037325 [Dionaea muscipula]